MKKVLVILIILLVLVSIFLIRNNENDYIEKKSDYIFSESELRTYQDKVVRYAQENDDLDWMGCGVQRDDDGYYVYLELREFENVDYEALKEEIYKEIGLKFPLEFELVKMPSEPSIEGIIRRIEINNRHGSKAYLGTLLVISDVKFIGQYKSPDAMEITITEKTVIEDVQGNPVSYNQIKTGLRVESYYRGMTLDSYPGQQGCEKLIVDLDYQRHKLSELVDLKTMQNKFNNQELTEPAYFAFGYDQSIENIGPFNQIWLHMEEGLEYYELDSPEKPVLYEGEIIMYVRQEYDEVLKHPFVFDMTLVPFDFVPVIEDTDEDGYMDIYMPYFEDDVWIEKCFTIRENEVIRNEALDKK